MIVDIALSELHLEDILRAFHKIKHNGSKLVYIDHHPEPLNLRVRDIPGEVIHNDNVSASELTYKYFSSMLDRDMCRVALYGAICDYMDTTEWVIRELENWDKRTIYFEAGVLSQGLEGSRKMYDFKRHIVKHLAEGKLPSSLSELLVRALIETVNEEELRLWIKHNIKTYGKIAYVINPPGSLTRAATYTRAISNKPIGIAIEVRNGKAIMSLRTISERINLNSLLRVICPKLGGTGGGHIKAAGARIPYNNIQAFFDELNKRIKL